MSKKIVLTFALLLLFSGIFGALPNSAAVINNHNTSGHNNGKFAAISSQPIRVPDSTTTTIQEAINAANEGDTIQVSAGTYYEHVVVNKSVSIIGENRDTTIIDGNGTGNVVYIVSHNVTISGFTIQHGSHGVLLVNSHGNNVSGNFVSHNWRGISLESSFNNTLNGNIVEDNWDRGIGLWFSGGNTLRNNSINGTNYCNFNVFGHTLSQLVNDVDSSNTVEGKPVYYWINQANRELPLDAGFVAIVNSTGIAVRDLTLTNNGEGVLIAYSNSSTVENVNASFNEAGILLINSYFNNISGNVVSHNWRGISLESSFNNTLNGNIVEDNWDRGIGLWFSGGNVIIENNVTGTEYIGFTVVVSGGNTIYHNNFVSNSMQFESIDSMNVWNTNYPSGGNYWSDYTGIDVKSGPNQDQPSSDGVGDTAYIIDANNRDHYPLMCPWGAPSPPSYTLTICSSPTGVTFTVDGISRTTPWSGTYSEGTSVRLVMPDTHDGYVWSRWLEDKDTNRIKTVAMDTNISLTGVFAPVPPPLSTVDIDPDTLNLESKGKWITCYIELPEGYNVSDIDRATIMLNGTISVDPFWVDKPLESVIGDYDEDGILDLMAKFSRAAVSEYIITQGIPYGNVTLTITGEVYGTPFEGSDTIRVLSK